MGDGMSWREFVTKQNPNLYIPREPDLRYYPFNTPIYRSLLHPETEKSQLPPQSSSCTNVTTPTITTVKHDPEQNPEHSVAPTNLHLIAPIQHAIDVDSAFDLLEQLLHPESTKRITPKRALAHPFLAGKPDEDDALPDDDEFVPHEFGKGPCAEWHFKDDATEKMCVKVKVKCEYGGCEGVEREELRTVMPGEGICIGREPCEFHQDMDLGF